MAAEIAGYMNFLPGVRFLLYLGEIVCHAMPVSYEKCSRWHSTCQRYGP